MIIKLIKDVATDEMSNGVVLSEIGCPKKDVDKLIGIFELFDKSVKDIRIKDVEKP